MLNFFNSVEHLEPRCPKCRTVLDYGVNTEFDDSVNAHICLRCDSILE